MGTNESDALMTFKRAFLDSAGVERFRHLEDQQRVNLRKIASKVLEASVLVEQQILPDVLPPIELEFRRLNKGLPPSDQVDIRVFRDKGWQADVAREITAAVNQDWLDTLPDDFLLENVLSNDANASQWGEDLVDFIKAKHRQIVVVLLQRAAERRHLQPLRDKLHKSRKADAVGKIKSISGFVDQFQPIQVRIDKVRLDNPMPAAPVSSPPSAASPPPPSSANAAGAPVAPPSMAAPPPPAPALVKRDGGSAMRVAKHRKAVNALILAEVGKDVKAALGLRNDTTLKDIEALETRLAAQKDILAEAAKLGSGRDRDSLIEGLALVEDLKDAKKREANLRERAAYAEKTANHRWPDALPAGTPAPKPFARSKPIDPNEDPNDLGFSDQTALLQYVVLSTADIDGRSSNLHAMFDEPVAPEARANAQKITQKARANGEVHKPLDLDEIELNGGKLSKVDFEVLKSDKAERDAWREEIDKKVGKLGLLRMGGSKTMGEDNKYCVRAKVNWLKADEKVSAAAKDPSFDVTGENLIVLMQDVNEALGAGVFDDKDPGTFRKETPAAAGDISSPVDMGLPPPTAFAFAPADEVEREMKELCAWVAKSLKAGDDPIEIAGLAYQRMVSIHPFRDGNGRSSRFLMDFVLQREGLLPAALGDDVMVAQFTRLAPDAQPSTTGAVNVAAKGVEAAYAALEPEKKDDP